MRALLLLLTTLLIGTGTFAQQLDLVVPGYYRKDTVYVMNGYRYRCIGTKGIVRIYNADYQNQWEGQTQVYKETGKYFDFDFGEEEKYNPIIDDYSMSQKVLNIIDNAFTKEFTASLKDYEKLTVTLFLNSETGKVEEVSFWFTHFGPFATLPLSTYRNIELQLIRDVSYTPSAIGKQLNYIMLSLMRRPKGASSSDTGITPSEPGGEVP